MPASRRPFPPAPSPRRPLGPRCHGGASSLLRLGFGAVPQRAASTRVSSWMEISESFDAAQVEHVVGWSGRDRQAPNRTC
ncbi:MAG: hypothetical protein ABI745_08970 [Caldimonas sp.]